MSDPWSFYGMVLALEDWWFKELLDVFRRKSNGKADLVNSLSCMIIQQGNLNPWSWDSV